MTSGMLIRVFVGIILLAVCPLWAQVADSGGAAAPATGPSGGGGAMVTPAPVSGEGYSMGFTSETRSNYLRGGLTFGTAYDSDATTGTNGQPISDVSYSIWPTISLDQTRSRLHWVLNYAPGFTFYQKTSSLNQADQNLGVNLSYRLSPHVTLSVRDTFVKTSNILNQPTSDLASPVSGGVSVPNNSVIAPITDTLTNNANVSITYQFSANGMVGASGTFTNLHYPNPRHRSRIIRFEFERADRLSIITASRRCTISVLRTNTRCSWPIRRGGRARLRPRACYLFYTVYLKPTVSDIALRRPAILQHAAVRATDIDLMVSSGRREHELAGEADKFCSQLLKNHQ